MTTTSPAIRVFNIVKNLDDLSRKIEVIVKQNQTLAPSFNFNEYLILQEIAFEICLLITQLAEKLRNTLEEIPHTFLWELKIKDFLSDWEAVDSLELALLFINNQQ